MSPAEFRRRYLKLVVIAWQVPPVFGLGFLVFVVQMFTAAQVGRMLLVPPLNLYIVASIVGPYWYFKRYGRDIEAYLGGGGPVEAALERARRFPLHFWVGFLGYLVVAPVMVMASAVLGTDFRPEAVDWFRIELVSLIVSIIVGLPVFFLVVDLFGNVFCAASLPRAHVTVRAKVFLIAALVPLLIDTMLVQYYWTVTGYFTLTTFFVWLFLEALAVVGALIFMRSFQQSLAPLRGLVGQDPGQLDPDALAPQSTDEIGVVTDGYRKLLKGLHEHREVLELQNRVLRSGRKASGSRSPFQGTLEVARDATKADVVVLFAVEGKPRRASAVASLGADFEGVTIDLSGSCVLASALDNIGVTSADLSLEGEGNRVLHETCGCSAAVACPLVDDDQVIGLLVAAYHESVGALPQRMEELFQATAAEAATDVRLSMLEKERNDLEHRLRVAERLESVGRLAGGVAHDFNNILTAIMASCSLVERQTPEGDEAHEYLQEIQSASHRAAELTRQLLAFSRRQHLLPEVLNLNQIIIELDSMLRRVLREDIELVTSLSQNLHRIKADRSQVEQVLMNLVVNARDALPDGGRITISTRNDDAETGYVECRVEDNGSGIAADVVPHVFDPFFTTKATGSGSGLGLATVHGIMAQSGGRISVRSKPGQGASFTLKFPVSGDAAVPAVKGVRAPTGPGTNATILLVEDDTTLRAVVASMLEQEGFSVIAARGPEHAIELAQEHGSDIDLMLSDVIMPGMRGPELAREFASINDEAKVVLMSGYADERTMSYAREAGLPLVNKPFTPDKLFLAIDKALKS